MKVLTIPEHCTRTHGANCTRCQLACPAKAISFDEAGAPVIDRDACTKCGVCMGVCDAFSSSSATALRLYDHLRKVAMRGEIVYLTCEENVFPGFEPAKNVTVLPCLACVPPELWTLLLAQNVPVCVACDLKYCEDCPRAAQIGELLFTKAIEIAEAQTGENVHFDREIPEYVPPVEAVVDDEFDRRAAFDSVKDDAFDIISGRRRLKQSDTLKEAYRKKEPQPQDLRRGGLLPGLRAVVRDLGGESGLVLDEAPVFGAVAAVGAYEQRRHGDGVEHEVFFHGFRDLVARKVRRKGPVRFLFFRKQPLHDEGDALGDERHQRLPVAACEGGDAPVVGEEEFVDPRQLPASERLLAQLQPRGPYGPHGQFPFDALRAGGRQHRVSRDGEQRGVVGFAEDSLPVATHGDIGSRVLRHTAGQLRRRFAGRGRGLGERQVVAERHGLGLEAPESVAVVERHPRGGETLLAVGPQFDAHESRHPRRIAFRGGEGLDAGREACGCISPAEQLARCGVELCGVRLRIAGAAPGEVDRLI